MCFCGDSECPSCGSMQGTLTEYVVDKITVSQSVAGYRVATVFLSEDGMRHAYQFRLDTRECIGWWEPNVKEARRAARVAIERY